MLLPTVVLPAVCGASHKNSATVVDYVPHYAAFMFYNSKANPHHLRRTSIAMIGHTDQAMAAAVVR
jgi:hypothetical protein